MPGDYQITLLLNERTIGCISKFIDTVIYPLEQAKQSEANYRTKEWFDRMMSGMGSRKNKNIFILLGYTPSGTFTHGWNPVRENTIQGYLFPNFTEQQFPLALKLLQSDPSTIGMLEISHQIYSINEELNGN